MRGCGAAQVRLVQQEGDLVCGMDFHVDVREGWDRHWRNIPAAEIMPYGPHGPQLGVRPPLPVLPILTPRNCSDDTLHPPRRPGPSGCLSLSPVCCLKAAAV